MTQEYEAEGEVFTLEDWSKTTPVGFKLTAGQLGELRAMHDAYIAKCQEFNVPAVILALSSSTEEEGYSISGQSTFPTGQYLERNVPEILFVHHLVINGIVASLDMMEAIMEACNHRYYDTILGGVITPEQQRTEH